MNGLWSDIRNRKALVTGGSGDIGRAICKGLALAGAQVTFTYFSDHDGARTTADVIESHGVHKAQALRVNFGDATSSAEFFEAIKDEGSSINLLVHCAASGVFRPTMSLAPRHTHWSFDVNTQSLLSLVQLLTQPKAGASALSSIVCLSSLGAVRAIPQYAAAAMSKAALEALARHLALELGPKGIRINVVSPGLVLTGALEAFPNRDQLTGIAQSRTPLGRLATPEDVASTVLFLCSSASSVIHGQTINIDGGYSVVG